MFGYHVPICVDISKIKDSNTKTEIFKVEFINGTDEYCIVMDNLYKELFGKEEDLKEFINMCDIIYDSIDNTVRLTNGKTFNETIGINCKEEFINFVINSSITDKNEINLIYTELCIYIWKAKSLFTNNVLELFEYNKVFPVIPNKDSTPKPPQEWLEYCSYPIGMIGLQTIMEYPTQIIFPENIGKAYSEFSWREIEVKRIYLSKKSKLDNYLESIKGWITSEIYKK